MLLYIINVDWSSAVMNLSCIRFPLMTRLVTNLILDSVCSSAYLFLTLALFLTTLPPMLLYLVAHLLLTLASFVTSLLSPTLLHITPVCLLWLSFILACSCLKAAENFNKPHIQNLQYRWSATITLAGPACITSAPGLMPRLTSQACNSCYQHTCSSCPSAPTVPPPVGTALE